MKLYNVFYICKSCLPALKKMEDDRLLRNWENCRKALDSLQNLECFKETINDFYNFLNWKAKVYLNEIVIPNDEVEWFFDYISKITHTVETLVKLCDNMEMGKIDSGIDVKIPECKSLKEYMYYLKEIDFIFTQCPYLLYNEEEIQFKGVDVGSQWLTFAVIGAGTTFYILNNIAKLIQKAVAIKSNVIVYRQQEEMLKEMQLKNNVLEETVEVLKGFKQDILNKSVSELESEIGELQDGEERDKVKKTLEDMIVLMDKGVEIYSSIETPKEIKVLFPFQEDTAILPDEIMKFIEEKKCTENKQET